MVVIAVVAAVATAVDVLFAVKSVFDQSAMCLCCRVNIWSKICLLRGQYLVHFSLFCLLKIFFLPEGRMR